MHTAKYRGQYKPKNGKHLTTDCLKVIPLDKGVLVMIDALERFMIDALYDNPTVRGGLLHYVSLCDMHFLSKAEYPDANDFDPAEPSYQFMRDRTTVANVLSDMGLEADVEFIDNLILIAQHPEKSPRNYPLINELL